MYYKREKQEKGILFCSEEDEVTVAAYVARSATPKALNRKRVSPGAVERKCMNLGRSQLSFINSSESFLLIYRQDILRTLESTTYILSNILFTVRRILICLSNVFLDLHSQKIVNKLHNTRIEKMLSKVRTYGQVEDYSILL